MVELEGHIKTLKQENSDLHTLNNSQSIELEKLRAKQSELTALVSQLRYQFNELESENLTTKNQGNLAEKKLNQQLKSTIDKQQSKIISLNKKISILQEDAQAKQHKFSIKVNELSASRNNYRHSLVDANKKITTLEQSLHEPKNKFQLEKLIFTPIKDKEWVKQCNIDAKKYDNLVKGEDGKPAVCNPESFKNYYVLRNKEKSLFNSKLAIAKVKKDGYLYRGSRDFKRWEKNDIYLANVFDFLPYKDKDAVKTTITVGSYTEDISKIEVFRQISGENSYKYFGKLGSNTYEQERVIYTEYTTKIK